ncbi:MAG: lytic transglycosylase [Polaromonas sp.]|nr:lytic transglycosylase [Polaromonas sp.]
MELRPAKTRLARAAALAVPVLLTLHLPQARADIWGYVDEERIPHFASSRLDERYEIFLRDSEAVEPFRRQDNSSDLPRSATGSSGGEDTPSTGSGLSATSGTGVPPKLLTFFEQSRSYRAISPVLQEASRTHGVDYSLLKALITTESGFNTNAVSPKGAVGLMQLIPPTAERYGVVAGKNTSIAKKLTDPKINIMAGARYLADLIRMFPGRLELALAAYNAGEGAVQRAGNRIPNYPETQSYVKTVMQLYRGLALAAPVAPLLAPVAGTARPRGEAAGTATPRSDVASPEGAAAPWSAAIGND